MAAEYFHGFYLGDLFVEPLKGRVTGKNGSRHLPPRAAEVLVCLARRSGDVVTHEDLIECAWGAEQGSREALSHVIGEIRHALEDQPASPRYIQTLPRRGYRLIVTPVVENAHTGSIVIGGDSGAALADLGLFENLRRRGVIETAIAYGVLGWLLIQIADVVFAQLGLPEWTGMFVTILVIAGFPIALVLSWFLEIRDGKAVLDDLSPLDVQRRRFSRTYISIVSALASAAVLVFAYDVFVGLPKVAEETPPPPTEEEIFVAENSIAVLPFLNNDGSEQAQIFANGLVDDVITRLSRVPGLLVSSRGDSATLEPNTPSAKVRQRLRVAMYLEGSVEIRNDKIRVIVQLIDSSTGFHILSRTFDRPTTDFFGIRDEVTQLTVSSLRVTLPEHDKDLLADPTDTPELDAYLLYRRGADELNRPRTEESTLRALDWFDAALDVDPEYAAAHAGRCRTLAWQFGETAETELVGAAESACSKALDLNPNLDIVHIAMGRLYIETGRFDAAEQAFLNALRIDEHNVEAMIGLSFVYLPQQRPQDAENILMRAVGLQPGNWEIYNALGIFYFRLGRYEDAARQFREIVSLDTQNMRGLNNMASAYMMAGDFAAAMPAFQKSIDIEPETHTYANLGMMNYYLGRYDEAEAALRQAISMAPRVHLNWSNLGDILQVAGREDAAREAYMRAEELIKDQMQFNPGDPGNRMDHAWVHAMLGNRLEALDAIEQAIAAAPDDPYGSYIKGLIHHRFGNSQAALDALERAVDQGYSTTMLWSEPLLHSLRDEPRFKELTQRTVQKGEQ